MRLRTERLQSYNQPEDVEKVRLALDDLYDNMETLLNEVDELYLGPDEDVKAMKDTYAEIQEAQYGLLEFAIKPSSTLKVIAQYEEENLYHLYDRLEQNAEKILTYVHGTQQSIFTSAEKMSRTSFMWSVVIITAMVLGLLFFQSTIRKMSSRLYNKSKQFELLSDTIDETFLIFGKGDKCDFVSGNSEKVLGITSDILLDNRESVYKHMNDDTAKQLCKEIKYGEKTAWETIIEYNHPKSFEPRWLQARCYRMLPPI